MSPKPFLDFSSQIEGLGGKTVLDFWSWALSDISNTARGVLAEYLVSAALGCVEQPREEWATFDIKYREFGIEVKSSAYLQNWRQKKPSSIGFQIPKFIKWDADIGKYVGEKARHADLYVFSIYGEQVRERFNVLNTSAWDFCVVPTFRIDEKLNDQGSVAKSILETKLGVHWCKLGELRKEIDAVIEEIKRHRELATTDSLARNDAHP